MGAGGQTWNGDVVLLGPKPLGQVSLQVLMQNGILIAHGRHGLGQAGKLWHRSLLLTAQTTSCCQNMLPVQSVLAVQKSAFSKIGWEAEAWLSLLLTAGAALSCQDMLPAQRMTL